MELTALRGDRSWDRLFDEASDYQSVFVDLFPADAIHPRAGLLMQATLQSETLASLRRQHLSGGVWVIDHDDAYAALGLDAAGVATRFVTWIRLTTAVQGWSQSAAWIPMFDTYDDYRRTPYEEASTTDWFRSGLNGELSTGEWLTARLRGLAPEMWLEEALLVGLDLAALDRVATRERFGSLSEIRLRQGATLNDLERVFVSRLPVIADLRP